MFAWLIVRVGDLSKEIAVRNGLGEGRMKRTRPKEMGKREPDS